MKEYILAAEYAKITYIRRDVVFVMGGKKKGKEKGALDFTIEQKGIEDWVAQQYDKAKENTRIGGK